MMARWGVREGDEEAQGEDAWLLIGDAGGNGSGGAIYHGRH